MDRLEPMSHAIKHEKEIAPRDQLLVAVQVHASFVTAADEKLVNAHFVGDLLKRLFGVANGKRHQNGARPGRNFVDIEPEPFREQDDLWRNCRYCVVIVLPEEAEI